MRSLRGRPVGPRELADDVDYGAPPRVHPKKGVFRGERSQRPDVVAARKAFIAAQSALDARRLVFLDEAGVSAAESRRFGWAPRGYTPVIARPARARRLNLVGAIAVDGIRALELLDGCFNGETFLAFLRNCLGPTLNTGDIVVMDGSSIHKVKGVAEVLAEFGASALDLPGYSPELNPIEMTWAWMKKLVRDVPTRTFGKLKAKALETWNQVSAVLCATWTRPTGYEPST